MIKSAWYLWYFCANNLLLSESICNWSTDENNLYLQSTKLMTIAQLVAQHVILHSWLKFRYPHVSSCIFLIHFFFQNAISSLSIIFKFFFILMTILIYIFCKVKRLSARVILDLHRDSANSPYGKVSRDTNNLVGFIWVGLEFTKH